jgi:hypothetical protein
MTLQELVNRVRIYTRDFTGSIYRGTDIDVFLKEAFDRVTIIPELTNASYPTNSDTEITVIPTHYQYLLSLYASSRCLFQDEQDYRAGTLMNEFELKLDELKSLVDSGAVIIKDADGNAVVNDSLMDGVVDVYFDKTISDDELIF